MTLKTCLLVTDDPDDHQAFSEAASEISRNSVVLIVLDSQRALDFLKTKSPSLDFIFLDLFTHGIRINTFLKMIQTDLELRATRIIVYGDDDRFDKIEDRTGLTFFNKDYEYSQLRDFLKQFFEPQTGKNS